MTTEVETNETERTETMAKAKKKAADKFVSFTSSRGAKYQVPERLKDLSVSAIIRAMATEGLDKAAIAKLTGIRYQHVRNVLAEPPRATK